MRRLKVLQLIAGLSTGDHVGGAELFGIRLARHLAVEQFEVAVAGLWCYGTLVEEKWIQDLAQQGITANTLVRPRGVLVQDLSAAMRKLWSLVNVWRPDIINSHSERTDVLNLLIHLFHPYHPISVRTMHTDQQWQRSPLIGSMLINCVFPWAFDEETAISQSVQLVLDNRPLARILRKKSVLCYNGIDKAVLGRKSQKRPEELFDSAAEQTRIGVVGRLEEQKGYAFLIDAMETVVQKHPVHLYIIGSGSLEQAMLRQVHSRNLGVWVHFMGSRDDVLDIMPHLDMLVSSSLWEGFPTVLLEAMAVGTPVVATDVSGSRELIKNGETGCLVNPSDSVALANAILYLIENRQEAMAMARRAQQEVSHFTIQNTSGRFAWLYQKLSSSKADLDQ